LQKILSLLLIIFTFIIPWENAAELEGVASLARIVGATAVLLTIFFIFKTGHIKQLPKLWIPISLFLVWSAATLLWSGDIDQSLQLFQTLVLLICMVFLIWFIARDDRWQRRLLQSYLLGCLVSLYSLYFDFISGKMTPGARYTRYTGGELNENELAAILCIGISFALYFVSRKHLESGLWRIVSLCFIPLAIIGVLLTGSRGGAIGLAVTLLGAIGFYWTINRLGSVGLFVIFGCTLFAGIMVVPQALLDRITKGQTVDQFDAARGIIWRKGIESWQDNPFVGIGIGAYSGVVTGSPYQRGHVAHNTFLSILVNTGIIGFVIFLWILLLLGRNAYRYGGRERWFAFILLLAWLPQSLSTTMEFHKYTWFLIAWLSIRYVPWLPQYGKTDAVSMSHSEIRTLDRVIKLPFISRKRKSAPVFAKPGGIKCQG